MKFVPSEKRLFLSAVNILKLEQMLKYGTSKTCKEKYVLPELKVNQIQIPESFKLKQSKFHTVSARALPAQQNSKGFSNNDWSASTNTWTLSLLESLNDFWSVH